MHQIFSKVVVVNNSRFLVRVWVTVGSKAPNDGDDDDVENKDALKPVASMIL